MRIQAYEESESEAFMASLVENPLGRREEIAEEIRKSRRQLLVSRSRENMIPK